MADDPLPFMFLSCGDKVELKVSRGKGRRSGWKRAVVSDVSADGVIVQFQTGEVHRNGSPVIYQLDMCQETQARWVRPIDVQSESPDVRSSSPPSVSSPQPVPPPGPTPSFPYENPLRRTEEQAARDAQEVLSANLGEGDFIDVQCDDFRWMVGQIEQVLPGSVTESPVGFRVIVATETAAVTLDRFIDQGQIAPMGRYSATWVHALTEGSTVDVLDIYTSRSGRVRRKWRFGEVIQTTPDCVFVKLLNLKSDICVWLNMHCEGFRVAPYGSKTGIESEAQQMQRQSDEAFDAALLENGLRVVPMATDGNCLFRSFAFLVYGGPSLHSRVRHECVEHMRSYRDRFAIVAATQDSTNTSLAGGLDAYLEDMEKDCTWGGYPEVMAMEEVADRPVQLFSTAEFSEKGSVSPMRRLDDATEFLDTAIPIRLAYYGDRHYNAIVLAGQSAAEQAVGKAGTELLARFREEQFRFARASNEDQLPRLASPEIGEGTRRSESAHSDVGSFSPQTIRTARQTMALRRETSAVDEGPSRLVPPSVTRQALAEALDGTEPTREVAV